MRQVEDVPATRRATVRPGEEPIVIGFEQLREMIGRGRSPDAFRMAIWRWSKAGRFPKALRLGPNSVGWELEAVRLYIESCRQAPEPTPEPTTASEPVEAR